MQQRPSVVERILCILLGSWIAAFGFGLALLSLWFGVKTRWLAALPLAIALTFIGLFGLNWLVQGSRGRSRHEGLFYAILDGLRAVGPQIWSLLVPATALVGVIFAALAKDCIALRTSLVFLGGWLVFMVNIGIHELGHVLSATASGLRVVRIIVGPIEFKNNETGWRLGLSREWLSISGGFVLLASPNISLTPREALVFASGGPIASLMLFIFLMIFSPVSLWSLPDTSHDTLQQHLFDFAIICALGTLVANVIPAKQVVLGSPSDGYQILVALRRLLGKGPR